MNNSTTLREPLLAWPGAGVRPAPTEASQFDYRLARRIAGGDMQAFEEFYERHRRRVYTLCLRMTGNVAEAEDLAQEVFIHIYHKIGSFRGESSMTTWLHRVTVNKVLMHFRKSSVKREKITEDGESPEPIITGEEFPRQALTVDRITLDRAIAQLPTGYRTVFILHDVEGYEHSEIARMRGISVGTSKSQLHKARMRLRQLLKRDYKLRDSVREESYRKAG
ncbi:MAG TPA: RNA polymerase sigma factor [Pyrinomonadaceae bacterium]|nr:RNA polymerase sigma factor [Pyrinomonadaceae bacterium]